MWGRGQAGGVDDAMSSGEVEQYAETLAAKLTALDPAEAARKLAPNTPTNTKMKKLAVPDRKRRYPAWRVASITSAEPCPGVPRADQHVHEGVESVDEKAPQGAAYQAREPLEVGVAIHRPGPGVSQHEPR